MKDKNKENEEKENKVCEEDKAKEDLGGREVEVN